MLKQKNSVPLSGIKKSPIWAVIFSFILIIGVSRLLLFLESNIGPTPEAEASPLPQEVEINQMTDIIEDGYLK